MNSPTILTKRQAYLDQQRAEQEAINQRGRNASYGYANRWIAELVKCDMTGDALNTISDIRAAMAMHQPIGRLLFELYLAVPSSVATASE